MTDDPPEAVAPGPDARPHSAKSAAIARDLARKVVSGAWLPGTLLPGEHELALRHGASRPVVREAIRLLGGARLVEPRHGVGSVVRPARLWNVFGPVVLEAHLDDLSLPAIVDELLDLQPIERELPLERELVVYGGGVFTRVQEELLTRDAGRRGRRVGPEESDVAAAVGAVRLLEAYLAGEPP